MTDPRLMDLNDNKIRGAFNRGTLLIPIAGGTGSSLVLVYEI
ncbi:MAG: hypothetical protein ACOX22_12035 [Caldicoprobacterales bacterium]|jgi:hypothetical protein